MRYLPQTEADIQAMLGRIGVDSISDLFSGVPDEIKCSGPLDLPPALTEPELRREMKRLGGAMPSATFLGAGAYPHAVPAAVEQLLLRSELYTAYTPYQAEVAQGTLQTMFEFQTMVSEILGLDVANASLYDGASSTAEAALMALRIAKKRGKIVMAETVHPEYREVTTTFTRRAAEEIITVPFDPKSGGVDLGALKAAAPNAACIIVQSPTFFGTIEDCRAVAKIAQESGAILIVAVPEVMATALFESPGACGADIAVGEGLGYGVGVQVGGPACGLFAAKAAFLRQIPGRLVGETMDTDGQRGYVLTLSTREQHIRRDKATSNICTNQGLLALGFAMHMALLGKQGFIRCARQNLARALEVKKQLSALGLKPRFESAPHFNEVAYRVPGGDAQALADAVADRSDIVAGLPMGRFNEALKDTLLVCTTEIHAPSDLEALVDGIKEAL